jgi:predicted amidophosphoribosyltransferase
LQRLLRDVFGAFVSVFFPGDCRLCKGLLTNASRLPICGECLQNFWVMPPQICQLRGQPEPPALVLPSASNDAEVIHVCSRCQQQKYSFEVVRSFGQYEGGLARAIVVLKFERIEPLGEWFAEQLQTWCARTRTACKPT